MKEWSFLRKIEFYHLKKAKIRENRKVTFPKKIPRFVVHFYATMMMLYEQPFFERFGATSSVFFPRNVDLSAPSVTIYKTDMSPNAPGTRRC